MSTQLSFIRVIFSLPCGLCGLPFFIIATSIKVLFTFLGRSFASAGADGVITNITIESITAFASEIEGQGGHTPAVTCNLWDTSEVVALFNDWVRIDV